MMNAVAQLDGALGERAGAAGGRAPDDASRSASVASLPKLHPGPGFSHEQVASNQRARIYAAMIELVAERGYGAVTVSELARLARVSKHTVYERFGGKDGCFLATYELLVRRSIKQVGAAQMGCRDWQERLRLAFCAWVDGIACEPNAARLALVEAFAGGPAALERMHRSEEMFAAMIEQSFARAPDRIVAPPLVVRGIVAGMARVARARLLADRERELPGLADELLEWAFSLRCQEVTALGELEGPARMPPPRTDGRDSVLAIDGGEDDRTRILDAVARLAYEDGYWQLTIPRIRAAAGVSRKAVDAQFEDVQGCFIASLEHLAGCALAHAASAGAGAQTWPGGLHRALHALCTHIAADPVLARLGFIEVFAPGPDGMRCRERAIAGVAASFRASAPAAQRPSELHAEASLGAVWGVMHRYIAHGHAHRLPCVAPVLSFLALAPAIGAEQAIEAIAAEHARMCDGVMAAPVLAASPG